MAFAHAHGVLHRDLKPQNVMVGSFGEALVMDWGLAKSLSSDDPDTAEARTGTPLGTVLGTPGFIAPEQARGGPVDARADIFSLGCVLRFLIEGSEPDRSLGAIVEKATAAEPDARYAEVKELAEDVSRFLDGEPVLADPEGILRRGLRLLKGHRVAAILVLVHLTARALTLFFLGR